MLRRHSGGGPPLRWHSGDGAPRVPRMVKVVAAILSLAMVAHIIRPFGLPGLTRRADAWKLAVAALLLVVVVTLVRPE